MSGHFPHRREFDPGEAHDSDHEFYVEGEYGSGSTSYPTHYDESGELRRSTRESSEANTVGARPETSAPVVSSHFGAGARAKDVPGVSAEPPDNWIWEQVCLSLTEDPYIDASSITVVVEKGIVSLQGSVRDAAMRERIMVVLDAQSWVRGIEDNLVYPR